MQWEAVIGLEIHVQLATKSKIFSAAANRFGAKPNTQACAVDLGLPGVLPVPNKEAIHMAVQFGLAVGARIAERSVFARKHYFYPDLPKGYQISQFELPIVHDGEIQIGLDDGVVKKVGITRAHLEEDAGKSIHGGLSGATGIDLNRAGTPLLEVVSAPDMRSAKEALAYMKRIHAIVRYLGISDGNMQEGSFRCDANISIREKGAAKLGARAEIKNINSFRFVEQAINHEIARQTDLLEAGQEVAQETRLYDPEKNETRSMRGKEEANDYRYFPDPDLLPVVIDKDFIDAVKAQLPELPEQKQQRFINEFGLSEDDSRYLTASKEVATYFEAALAASGSEAKQVVNWVRGEVSAALNKDHLEIDKSHVSAEMLASLIKRIEDNTLSNKIAKQVFEAMWRGEGSADEIIEKKGLRQVTDSGEIEKLVNAVLTDNPDQVEQYRRASTARQAKLMGYFIGQVMGKSKGKANPGQVNALLTRKLKA